MCGKEAENRIEQKVKDIRLYGHIAKDFGKCFSPGSVVLDFGCGDGQLVDRLREKGFDAYGTDVLLNKESDTLRLIRNDTKYRFPFPDQTFDAVISCSVLEHVRDLSEAVAEMSRVLKPGGFCLHFFPPQLRIIEGHTFVPLAGVLQNYPWLLFWSVIGVRNSFSKKRGFVENATHNHQFLNEKTAYRSKRELSQVMTSYFNRVVFAEKEHIKHSYGRARKLYRVTRALPFIARLYSTFHMRVLYCEK